MKREVDRQSVAFTKDERLWRRIAKNNVDKRSDEIKAHSIRLQVSVFREQYGDIEKVCVDSGNYNGIAQTTAAEVASANGEQHPIVIACVDEPREDNAAHSLIAFFMQPGEQAEESALQAARASLAAKFTIVRNPK